MGKTKAGRIFDLKVAIDDDNKIIYEAVERIFAFRVQIERLGLTLFDELAINNTEYQKYLLTIEVTNAHTRQLRERLAELEAKK